MKPEFITEVDWKCLKEKYNDLKNIIEKLNHHYPVQYLIGNVDFYNCDIKVDERALIPRYETEFLVEKTIEKIKELKINNPKILDIGTGSGCISIALKKNIECEIVAIDISKDAISLAKENALRNNVSIKFGIKDMRKMNYENYDVIISNPPYVSEDEKVGLETKYEPPIALYAKKNGLYYYEEIIRKISKMKTKPKLICFEIGSSQKDQIKEINHI